MNTRTRNRLVAAVAAVLPLAALTLPAGAQVRANQNGRALDGNTRVGSDGSNDRSNGVDNRGYTGNQVVTGNVTGARSFRGPINYSDPTVFAGPTSGRQTDRFVRDSSGAPTRSQPSVDYGRSTGFYSDARATPLPPGYRADSFSGGFYNTGVSQETRNASPAYQSTSAVYGSQTSMLRSGNLVLGEGVDENNQPQVLTASPIYGLMQLNPTLLRNNANDSALSRTDTINRRNPSDRSGLNADEVERMRREVNDAAREAQDAADDSNANNLARPLESSSLNSALSGTPRDRTTGTATLDGRPGNAVQNASDRPANQFETSQGLERRVAVEPARQSKQYADLQERLRQVQGGRPQTPEEAIRDQRLLKRAQESGAAADPNALAKPDDEKAGAPNRPRTLLPPTRGPAARPGAAPAPAELAPAEPAPGATIPAEPAAEPAPAAPRAVTPPSGVEPAGTKAPAAPAEARPAPLKIKSLAEGVEAKGLHDVLKSAEEQMKAGNFRDAIDKYATAEQVAPNNPLIRLGRAQAELGATRYGSAEQSLRQAVGADPALLMGQYDLESFLGRDRLAFLVKDLKQVSNSEAASPRPKLLLAYIAYGMPGQEAAAAAYLNEAAERAGKPDPLIEAMRKHWALPAASEEAKPADSDLNK